MLFTLMASKYIGYSIEYIVRQRIAYSVQRGAQTQERRRQNLGVNSSLVKPVSRFTGYPVEELKSGWLTVLTKFHLATKNLYLKLTIRINWQTGKQVNWVTK